MSNNSRMIVPTDSMNAKFEVSRTPDGVEKFIKGNDSSGMSTPPEEESDEERLNDMQAKAALINSNNELLQNTNLKQNFDYISDEEIKEQKSSENKEKDTEGELSEGKEGWDYNKTTVDYTWKQNLANDEGGTFEDALIKTPRVHKTRLSQIVPEPSTQNLSIRPLIKDEENEFLFRSNPLNNVSRRKHNSLINNSLSGEDKDNLQILPLMAKHSLSHIKMKKADLTPSEISNFISCNSKQISFKDKLEGKQRYSKYRNSTNQFTQKNISMPHSSTTLGKRSLASINKVFK